MSVSFFPFLVWNWILNSKKINYSQFWENFILLRKLRLHLCLILRRATPLLPSKNPKLSQKSTEDGNSGSFNPSPLGVEFKAFSLTNIWSSLHHLWRDLGGRRSVLAGGSVQPSPCVPKRPLHRRTMPRSTGLGNPLPSSTRSLPMWDVKPEWKFGQRREAKLFPSPPQIRKRRAPTRSSRHPAPMGMVKAFWGSGLLSLGNNEGEK